MNDKMPDDRASAHWPIVPPDATSQATDPEEVEHELPGGRWRMALLGALIVLVFAGLVGVVLMFGTHVGGGR